MKEKRADILLESCTRTSSMLFGGLWMAQAHQRQQSSLAIDGGVEWWARLTRSSFAACIHPPLPQQWHSCNLEVLLLHHNAFCLLDQVLLQDCRRMHASATFIVDKVNKAKIPMVTGGYGNGGRLDVNRTANAMGIWQCRYYSNGQKLQPPVMKPGGIALFFSLSVNERYGTEMKILPTFCQYNRVKPWKFAVLKIEWVEIKSGYLKFKLRTFWGAQMNPNWKRISDL